MFVSSLEKLKYNTYFILYIKWYKNSYFSEMSCGIKRDSHYHCKLHYNALCGLFSSPAPQSRKIKHNFFSASVVASNGSMFSCQWYTDSSNHIQAAVQGLRTHIKMCFEISERCKGQGYQGTLIRVQSKGEIAADLVHLCFINPARGYVKIYTRSQQMNPTNEPFCYLSPDICPLCFWRFFSPPFDLMC